MIKDLLIDKTPKEKARIKSQEIEKLAPIGKFKKDNIEIEVVGSIKATEIKGNNGIELFARAWKNNKQLGFGKDGSVDIERFRIFNPPILVDDPNGDIIKEWIDEIEKKNNVRKLREDPQEAIKQSLLHTISIVGKENTKIIKGSIGNTTSTFYPVAGANSPMDGSIRNQNATWSTLHDAADGNLSSASYEEMYANFNPESSSDKSIWRSIFCYDASAIPDTDTIDSATISLWLVVNYDTFSTSQYGYSNIVGATPASTANIANADYDQLGTTKFASDLDHTGLSTGQYQVFTLNASGLANISKTVVSKFGVRVGFDIDNVEATPAGTNNAEGARWQAADYAGTTQDPKLVVVHTTPVVGPAKLKTYDGVAKASIKTINGTAIASVKTIDGVV